MHRDRTWHMKVATDDLSRHGHSYRQHKLILFCVFMENIAGYRYKLSRAQREFGCSEKRLFGARISRLLNGSARTPSEATH